MGYYCQGRTDARLGMVSCRRAHVRLDTCQRRKVFDIDLLGRWVRHHLSAHKFGPTIRTNNSKTQEADQPRKRLNLPNTSNTNEARDIVRPQSISQIPICTSQLMTPIPKSPDILSHPPERLAYKPARAHTHLCAQVVQRNNASNQILSEKQAKETPMSRTCH